jgi:hypothetical protein
MAGKLFKNITAVYIMINVVLFNKVSPETFSPHLPSIYFCMFYRMNYVSDYVKILKVSANNKISLFFLFEQK